MTKKSEKTAEEISKFVEHCTRQAGVLIGKQAPNFQSAAVLGNGSIVEDFDFYEFKGNSKAVVFFYPLDFTFVCPSELIAFDNHLKEFEERDCKVVGLSIDSQFSHFAWRNTPINQGGIGEVKYSLVADINHKICRSYGVEADAGVAYRGSFLIDSNNMVRHQVVNDLPLGRSIDEMLRMVDALDFFENNGEVCPANWSKGDAGMKADAEGVADYLSKHGDKL